MQFRDMNMSFGTFKVSVVVAGTPQDKKGLSLGRFVKCILSIYFARWELIEESEKVFGKKFQELRMRNEDFKMALQKPLHDSCQTVDIIRSARPLHQEDMGKTLLKAAKLFSPKKKSDAILKTKPTCLFPLLRRMRRRPPIQATSGDASAPSTSSNAPAPSTRIFLRRRRCFGSFDDRYCRHMKFSGRLQTFGPPLLLQRLADVVRRLQIFWLRKNKRHLRENTRLYAMLTSPRSLIGRSISNIQTGLEVIEELIWKAFGEYICVLSGRWNMEDSN
ncbi:hypothetical protein LXL04_038160 [Taraxacum kok-saghyz]